MNESNKLLPIIGITMGDPVGIGPEIIIKALSSGDLFDICRPVIFGDKAILEREIKNLNSSVTLDTIESLEDFSSSTGTINVIQASQLYPEKTLYAQPTI